MSNIAYRKIEPDNEIDKLLCETFTSRFGGWIEVGELKIVLTHRNTELLGEISEFDVRDDDILILGHPRSGTNWVQEMVWLIAHDCDFEGAKKTMLERCPYLEGSGQYEKKVFENFAKQYPPIDFLNHLKVTKEYPRMMKSHYSWDLLPKKIRENKVKPKIIYIYRNPKDVCVSFYHLTKSLCEYHGNFDEFCKLFLAGRTYYGPYWKTLHSYWKHRNEPNFLFLKFSDIKTNMTKILHQVANFFGKTLTDEQISKLTHHLSFESMKNNQYVNYSEVKYIKPLYTDDKNYNVFLRKGQVGTHKEEMSPEMIKIFDEWIEENTKETGLVFE